MRPRRFADCHPAGLALQATAIAWLGAILTPDIAYRRVIVPFMLAGTGMALVFAPSANAVLSSVRPQEASQASSATNAISELGGATGVAVLASVFSAHDSYASPAYAARLTAADPDRSRRSRHRRGPRPCVPEKRPGPRARGRPRG